jgi:hypothetical protein
MELSVKTFGAESRKVVFEIDFKIPSSNVMVVCAA